MTYDVISLAQTLIRYPSVTPDAGNVILFMEKLLSSMGFETRIMNFQSVSNLYARYGSTGPHLCFAGHLDVVPEGAVADWTHNPYAAVVENDILYGRGAVDMKGAIAAFVAAMSTRLPQQGSISLLLTGDEEGDAVDGTVRVLEELEKLGQIPDVCLVGEPTSEDQVGDTVKIGRRGSLSGHILVEGKQGHVAYPHRADNPVRRLINFLNELQDYTWDQGNEHFDPSHLEVTSLNTANRAVNVIPQRCEALFNIRYNTSYTVDEIKQIIDKLAAQHCNNYQLGFKPGAAPFLTDAPAWSHLVAQATGQSPQLSTSGGTSDARFIQKYCPVVELGLRNHTAHQIDEHVTVADLKALEVIYGRVIECYFS